MGEREIERRRLFTGGVSVAIASVAAGGAAQARVISGSEPWEPHQADAPHPLVSSDYVFLDQAEVAFVEAASERLIPADDLGPGAKECGVALFIDHHPQCAAADAVRHRHDV